MKYDCNNTAVFAREYRRMCKSYDECWKCPVQLRFGSHSSCSMAIFDKIDILLSVVQQWSDENPEPPTRQSIAMKLFPDLKLDSRGISRVCPKSILENAKCPMTPSDCWACTEEYWTKEVNPDDLSLNE